MTTTPNFQVAASIDFLKVELMAEIEHVDNRDIMVVKQTNPTGAEMSVEEFTETIAKDIAALGDANASKIPIEWPTGLKTIVEKYKFYVKEVFLKVEKVKDKKVSVEYALWIGIKIDAAGLKDLKKQPPFDLFMIKDLYLKIWNTEDPAVLKEMNFVDLKQLSGPPAASDA